MNLILILVSIFFGGAIAFLIAKFFNKSKPSEAPVGKEIPTVKWKFPLVGHSISFRKNVSDFMFGAYKEKGKIFKIQLFRKNIVVICDPELKKTFFKASEKNLSFYNMLNNLHFGLAFFDKPEELDQMVAVIKNSVKGDFSKFYSSILAEAGGMIKQMEQGKMNHVELLPVMKRFIANTTARCFIGTELTDNFFKILLKHGDLFNKTIGLTYMLPEWVLKIIITGKLVKYRRQMANLIDDEIQSYRTDPDKSTSKLMRIGVDQGFTNSEIAQIICCLMYVASENTSMLLHATITDLARHPDLWLKLRNEFAKDENDTDLFKNELLESCILESARLNSHVFAIARAPDPKTKTIGDFSIADSDQIVMCELIMMVLGKDIPYSEPTKYDPERFLAPRSEPKTDIDILSWGAIVHQCPGKGFALAEIKAAVALMIKTFEPFEVVHYGKPDYFSTASFVDRKVIVNMKPLELVQEKN